MIKIDYGLMWLDQWYDDDFKEQEEFYGENDKEIKDLDDKMKINPHTDHITFDKVWS